MCNFKVQLHLNIELKQIRYFLCFHEYIQSSYFLKVYCFLLCVFYIQRHIFIVKQLKDFVLQAGRKIIHLTELYSTVKVIGALSYSIKGEMLDKRRAYKPDKISYHHHLWSYLVAPHQDRIDLLSCLLFYNKILLTNV